MNIPGGPETKTEYSWRTMDTWTRYQNNADSGKSIKDFAKKRHGLNIDSSFRYPN
jgi:hypothetical protein